MKRSTLVLLCALPLNAEFLSVEMRVSGLECASCARSVDKVLRKIKGVESASFRAEDGTAVVQLKPGNMVPLDEIRDALKRVGYTPGDANVKARGAVTKEGDAWQFRPAGLDRAFALHSANDESAKIRAADSVIIEGQVPAPRDRTAPEVLLPRIVRPAE